MTLEQKLRQAAEDARGAVAGRQGRPIGKLARGSNTARWAMGATAVALVVAVFSILPGETELPPVTEPPPIPTTAPETETTTENTPPTTTPPPPGAAEIFPNQVSVPMMMFVDGAIYDLSEVPARVVLNTEVSSHPYDSEPMMTEHGLLYSTGDLYSGATLFFQPLENTVLVPYIVSENVASFIVSPDSTRIAWAEFTHDENNIITQTRIVEASLPDFEILRETEFTGFDLEWGEHSPANATVVTYVGSTVLLMTGDGGLAFTALWVAHPDFPGTPDDPARVIPFLDWDDSSTGNSHGTRVVVSDDIICGKLVGLMYEDDGFPTGTAIFNPDGCIEGTSATFSRDGSWIATLGGPLRIYGATNGEFVDETDLTGLPHHQTPAIQWVSDTELLVLAYRGIFRCEVSPLVCELVQEIVFTETDWNQLALVRRP